MANNISKTIKVIRVIVNCNKCKLANLIRKLVLLCVQGTRVTKTMNNECSESDSEYGCFVSKIGF